MSYAVMTPDGLIINTKAMLETGLSMDEVNRQLHGSRCICLQCFLARKQITQSEAERLDRTTLLNAVDSRFRSGHLRRAWNPITGDLSGEPIMVEPHYYHPEPLLSEDGEIIKRPCESSSQEHVAFLDWLMGSRRDWCLDGVPEEDRTLLLREPRYRKDPPTWRSPDLAVVRCNGIDPEKVIQVISRTGHIPEHAVQMVSAIELQLSRISVESIKRRTLDHVRHFADVRWVFVERHLNGTREARKWLADNGHEAFVILQEIDKSRIIDIELLPPPGKLGKATLPSPPLPCLRSLYVVWLAKGFEPEEALARAKGQRTELRHQGEEAVNLNTRLREEYGIDLPWETPYDDVESVLSDLITQEREKQKAEQEARRVEIARQILKRDEAERLEMERKKLALQRKALFMEILLERQKEQQRIEKEEQHQRDEARRQLEEEQRRWQSQWKPVEVIATRGGGTMVIGLKMNDYVRQNPWAEAFRFLGRKSSLGYEISPDLPGNKSANRVVSSLEGWEMLPADQV